MLDVDDIISYVRGPLSEDFKDAMPRATLCVCTLAIRIMAVLPAQTDNTESTQLSDIVELALIDLLKDYGLERIFTADFPRMIDAFLLSVGSFAEEHRALLSSRSDPGRRWREAWATARQVIILKYLGFIRPNTPRMTALAAIVANITKITEGEQNQA